jgi:internalin A
LVSDKPEEEANLHYWLHLVETLSGNSPSIIILNTRLEKIIEINKRLLRGQFENLKEIFVTDLGDGSDFSEVLDEIKHNIRRLPHVGVPVPRTWVRVREALKTNKSDHIRLDEYLDICRIYGSLDPKDGMQLSEYFHNIGVFLHYKDDVLLKKTVILNPNWGIDAVRKILDNKDIAKRHGQFTRDDIQNIWYEPTYADMHDELLKLMMNFGLCYEISNQKGAYIAPQLLSINQPQYEWIDTDNIIVRYTYELMPVGILAQLITKMHKYILDGKIVWKNGVVLKIDKTYIEIVEYHRKREIQMRIFGPNKKMALGIFNILFDQIHATYKNLVRHDKWIPCNCDACKTNPKPHYYPYETLQRFSNDNQDEIQCLQSYRMVSVRELIDDVIKVDSTYSKQRIISNQYIIQGDYIEGDKKMDGDRISISNSTIHGSVVTTKNITDSFNAIEKSDVEDDLKKQLILLTEAVEMMIKELPREEAEDVAEDMKVLAEQATKEKPNPKWYNVSIDGLIKAAENLGKVGEPVIELSRKVLSLLTMGVVK